MGKSADELKIPSKDVLKALGLEVSELKEMTRNWRGTTPLLTPKWKSDGLGKPSFYSFGNLVEARILLSTRSLRVEQGFISDVLRYTAVVKHYPDRQNPFHINYLGPSDRGATGLSDLKEYVIGAQTHTNVIFQQNQKENGNEYLYVTFETVPPGELPIQSFDRYERQNNGKWMPSHPKGLAKEWRMETATAPFSLTLHLNKVHYSVKLGLRKIGVL